MAYFGCPGGRRPTGDGHGTKIPNPRKVSYVTAKEQKKEIFPLRFRPTGLFQPARTVSIGSELSGIVRNVAVDVNDHVKAGDVLIELDDTKLKASVERAKANLELSKAAFSRG